MAACTAPCSPGTYESTPCSNTTNRVCSACTNVPPDATYAGSGTTSLDCPWTCNAKYYQDGDACAECPSNSWCSGNVRNTCPTNTESNVLSSSQNQCLCKAGYYGDGSLTGTSPCTICHEGSYCQGGNNNVSIACPANFTSEIGAHALDQCYCKPGYQLMDGKCQLCPAGAFCESGALNLCPANSFSPEGSSVLSSCQCVAGFYGLNGVCAKCPPNSFCTGGEAIQSCVANAVSAEQSTNSSACYCDRGYEGVANAECVACPVNTWCWTGVLNACPLHTSSPMLSSWWRNCTCDPGYFGPDGYACSPCAGGTFKEDQGSADCTECPDGFFCKEASVTPKKSSTGQFSLRRASIPTTCDAGTYQTGEGMTVCELCSPGSFQTGMGTTVCSMCAHGAFQTGLGTIGCDLCEPGKYQPAVGANSPANCTACMASTYNTGVGAAQCATCPPPCAPGSYETTHCELGNALQCSSCPAGRVCVGDTSNQVCSAGIICVKYKPT